MRKIYLLGIIMTLVTSAQAQEKSKFPQEPFTTDTMMVHDPVMAYENGTYYLYATGMGINMATSKDRKTWTVYPKGVLKREEIPAWTHDSVPEFKHHIWAPDIIKWNGKWWMMYSCSSFGVNTSAIGLLSNTTLDFNNPEYQWKDEGYVVCSKGTRDNWNAIDPNMIIDEKNQPWIVWGSFWDGIQMAKLDNTMHIEKGYQPYTVARRYAKGCESREPNPTSKYAGPNAIEAPFLFKHGDYYYLFVAWDYCCRGEKSNYRVVCGRSKNIEGPYVDHIGIDMRLGGGFPVIEGDRKIFEAAGHCSVYHFNQEDWFFCHGYSLPLKGASVLIQKKITWKDDWPYLK